MIALESGFININIIPFKTVILEIWAFLLSLSIVLAVLSVSISFNSNDSEYFHKFQIEHNITKATGKGQAELDKISEDIILYLEAGEDHILTKHFNKREVSHMKDVFSLYELNRNITKASLGFVIASILFGIWLKKTCGLNLGALNKRSIIYIICIIILALIFTGMIAMGFDGYFTRFHEIFFDNDLWLMDPDTDLMIQMLPIEFFMGMAEKIFVWFAISLFVILGMMIVIAYKLKEAKD